MEYIVSHQQVYAWVRKHQMDGERVLRDKRGRKKPVVEELDDQERLRLQIKELEAPSTFKLVSSDSRTEQRKRLRNLSLFALAGVARSACYKSLSCIWTSSARELEVRTLAKDINFVMTREKG